MPYNRRPGSSNRNEIVHIVVTGYKKKKDPSKHYVFVIDVTWNNSERFEVYRRYSDFFSFQTTLKALFPSAAGRRDEERVIPQLPKRIFVGRSHVARVAEARLEQINKYCQTLISLEPKISESAHVVGFFSPRIGDKQLPKLHLHRPASLHPQNVPAGSLFEEHVALAEYVAEDSSQVSFKAGDKVLVMSKDESGWWMCSVNGKVGWAPPSYLKRCTDGNCDEGSDSEDDYLGFPDSFTSKDATKDKDSDDSGVGDPTTNEPARPVQPAKQGFKAPEIDAEEYKAIDSYEAIGPGQISFEHGDVITVLDKMEDGWWFVSNGQDEGWAPCSYLQNINGDEEEQLTTSLDIVKYVTVDSYEAEEDDELSFPKGVVVNVLQKSLDGWWLVKYDDQVALAPATFLKRATGEQGEQLSSPTRRTSPVPPNYTPTFRQPPRKHSVMYKASLKGRPVGKRQHPLTTTSTATAAGSAVTTSTGVSSPKTVQTKPPVPVERTQIEKPHSPRRKTKSEGQVVPSSLSPQSSDSETEGATTSPTSPHSLPDGGIRSRIKQFENYSASESSISSVSTIGDESPSSPRRPIAVPRTRVPNPSPKPATPPKLRKQGRSHSAEELKSKQLTSPMSSSPRSIPQINEQLIKDEPDRPPRPRMSEIRRARADKMRSPSPRHGLGAVTEESEDSDTTSISSKSSGGSHTRGVPMKPKMKKGRSNSSADLTDNGLRPPLPERPRRRSDFAVEEEREPVAMATVPQMSRAGEDNPLNQQMADTLIKYILASNDPNLKEALRNIITSDPAVMNVLKE